MATTPVTGATTGTTQTQQTSNGTSAFDAQFAQTFAVMIQNLALQSVQNLQDLLGTSPQEISGDD